MTSELKESEKLAPKLNGAIRRLEEPESVGQVDELGKGEGEGEKKIVRGGVLNGRAISKPAPSYPAEAKHQGIQGTVMLQIVVDETGKVVKAETICGDPVLAKASIEAALKARFTPTLLSGMPVKVSGVITYRFVLQ